MLAYVVLTNEKLETENVPYSQVKLTLLVADAVEQPKAILVIGVDSNGEPEQEGEKYLLETNEEELLQKYFE